MNIQAVIAEDNMIYRSILRKILARSDHRVDVVAEAEDGPAAVELVAAHHPDLLLLDINMPKLNGFGVLEAVRRHHPGVKVLMLTMYHDESYVRMARQKGAHGFCTKDANFREILRAVDAVVTGNGFFRCTTVSS